MRGVLLRKLAQNRREAKKHGTGKPLYLHKHSPMVLRGREDLPKKRAPPRKARCRLCEIGCASETCSPSSATITRLAFSSADAVAGAENAEV